MESVCSWQAKEKAPHFLFLGYHESLLKRCLYNHPFVIAPNSREEITEKALEIPH